MNRNLIGTVALLLFAIAATVLLTPSLADHQAVAGACWRIGALMTTWWLAHPDLARLPRWMLTAVPVLMLVVIFWPKTCLLLIPLLIVLAIVKPRFGARKRPS
jgi:hypothetical protein